MSEKSVFDEISFYQAEIVTGESQIKQMIASDDCQKFNLNTIPPNINTTINDLQTNINDLKTCSNNFTNSFSHIVQMKNVELINHRLQIAKSIRKCCNLYNEFLILYNKNVSDRSILDIVKLVQTYSKLNISISPYDKIRVCDEIQKDINQKIEDVRAMIIEKINFIGFSNLTPSDLFQLIIVSSSADDFWSFFVFIDTLLATNDYTNFSENIEKLFLFLSKIEKLSVLMNQPALSDYIVSIQKMKDYYSNKIFENIRSLKANVNTTSDFPTFTNGVFHKLSQLLGIESKENIPVQFKQNLKKEIEQVSFFIYDCLGKINDIKRFQSLFINNSGQSEFLIYFSNLNNNLMVYIDKSNYSKLENDTRTKNIVLLLRNIFKFYYERKYASLSFIANDVIFLTSISMTSSDDYIKSFRTIFYSVAKYELTSIIASLFKILSKIPKNFIKNYENRYEIICSKFDDEIDIKDEAVSELIGKLQHIIDLNDGEKVFYSDLAPFVDEVTQAYNKSLSKPKSILGIFK